LQELERKKIREATIAEELRIKAENIRIKEWEKNFDENQKLEEEKLLKKFTDDETKKDTVNNFSDNQFKQDESKNNRSKIIN